MAVDASPVQVLARKELNYGRMDERDIRQLTEEVYGPPRDRSRLGPR